MSQDGEIEHHQERQKRKSALLFGAYVLAISAGADAAMPDFDVKRHCSEVAGFGGNPSEVLRQACCQQEQDAYNQLKPNWEHLPAVTCGHCKGVASSFGGPGSYMLLNACVQQERSARSSNDNFTFQK